MATCPECDAEVEIDDDDLDEMEVGDPWDCEACGSRLRVATLDPLLFDADDEDDDEEEEGSGSDDSPEDDEFEDDLDDDDGDDDDREWDE